MRTEAAPAFDSASVNELRGPNDLLQSTISQRMVGSRLVVVQPPTRLISQKANVAVEHNDVIWKDERDPSSRTPSRFPGSAVLSKPATLSGSPHSLLHHSSASIPAVTRSSVASSTQPRERSQMICNIPCCITESAETLKQVGGDRQGFINFSNLPSPQYCTVALNTTRPLQSLGDCWVECFPVPPSYRPECIDSGRAAAAH
jgi:hypothetical protein